MKISRTTWLAVVLLALFCVSMKIAVTLPTHDRLSGKIDADKMVAGIFSDKGQEDLNLDLKTGKLKFESPEEVVVVDDDPLEGWRLVSRLPTGNKQDREWELIVANPDGSETAKKFQFPSQPIVLDVNTVFDRSKNRLDLLDLRSHEITTQNLVPQLAWNDHLVRVLPSRRFLEVRSATMGASNAPNVFTANLYEFDDSNVARQLWSMPIHSFYSFQIIGDRVFLIPPNKLTIDEYEVETGNLVLSTNIPSEISQLLQASATASIQLDDLAVVTLRLEDTGINAPVKKRYWTFPGFEQVNPRDETLLFKMNYSTTQAGYAHYRDFVIDEIGVIDLKSNAVRWSHKLGSDAISFSQSKEGDRWCFRTKEHGFASFWIFDTNQGSLISHWSPFRWISWCLPAIVIGFVACCIALLGDHRLSTQWRWIVVFLLSTLYLIPFFTHLYYWKIFDRPMPFHHFIQGHFVGALIASAAWMAWGSGRLVVRLIPLFVVASLVFALSRLTLENLALTKEAVGSTWLASSLGFPICIGLRLVGVRGPRSSESSQSSTLRTIPIRDLFLFSTCIAVLLALSIPILKSIEMPSGFPPGTKQMIIGAVGMYVGLAGLLFCSLRQLQGLAIASVMGIAVCIAIASTYEFATGNTPLYRFFRQSSFEMAIFRVAASALITCYFCLECIFTRRPLMQGELPTEPT